MILYYLLPPYVIAMQKVTGALHEPQIPGPSSAQTSSHARRHHRPHFGFPPVARDRHITNGKLFSHTYTAASHRHILQYYPQIKWCDCSIHTPPTQHLTSQDSLLKPHRTSLATLTQCLRSRGALLTLTAA